jgi:hypothetical protein
VSSKLSKSATPRPQGRHVARALFEAGVADTGFDRLSAVALNLAETTAEDPSTFPELDGL